MSAAGAEAGAVADAAAADAGAEGGMSEDALLGAERALRTASHSVRQRVQEEEKEQEQLQEQQKQQQALGHLSGLPPLTRTPVPLNLNINLNIDISAATAAVSVSPGAGARPSSPAPTHRRGWGARRRAAAKMQRKLAKKKAPGDGGDWRDGDPGKDLDPYVPFEPSGKRRGGGGGGGGDATDDEHDNETGQERTAIEAERALMLQAALEGHGPGGAGAVQRHAALPGAMAGSQGGASLVVPNMEVHRDAAAHISTDHFVLDIEQRVDPSLQHVFASSPPLTANPSTHNLQARSPRVSMPGVNP